MSDHASFEQHVRTLISSIADRAPIDIDPMAMARQSAAAARGAVWLGPVSVDRSWAWGFLLVVLAATMVGAVLLGGGPSGPLVVVPASTAPSVEPSAVPPPKIGFALPAAGTVRSAPETGVLLFSYAARWQSEHPCCGKYEVWLYADGRLLWELEADRPFGASHFMTGVIEQRLTPEGVNMAMSAIIGTGLFAADRQLQHTGYFFWGGAQARNDGRMVELQWDGPWDPALPPAVKPTTRERVALDELHQWLRNPTESFPEWAWADSEIRPYVPSRYAVCHIPNAVEVTTVSTLLAAVPLPARAILETVGRPTAYQGCLTVSADEARELARLLEAAGYDRDGDGYGLDYVAPGAWIGFDPVLPHGDQRCRCG